MAEVKVKKEKVDVPVEHEHNFTVKFGSKGHKYTVTCHQPTTVLEAIKLHLKQEFDENVKCADENVLIKLGENDESPFVATHFPCCCVEENKCLVILSFKKPVQAKTQGSYTILPKQEYSIFLIDKEGGDDTKSKGKEVFRDTSYLSKLKYLYVYGEKGTTVEEALNQDGRFVDDLGDFTLSDNDQIKTKSTKTVNNLHGRKFRVCLPKKKKRATSEKTNSSKQQQGSSASNSPQTSEPEPGSKMKKGGKVTTNEILCLASETGISLKAAMEEREVNVDLKEIYKLLCEQFPDLKQQMSSRFPDGSFEKELELMKEDFGKTQQSFSEVHRMREVLELSRSVCLVKIRGPVPGSDMERPVQGTGFVLFDNFVLTNRHLFDQWAKNGKGQWWERLTVMVQFNLEKPDGEGSWEMNATVFGGSNIVDYALLQLTDNQNTGQETNRVPPGLLKRFAPLPDDGQACIVGHPAGQVKTFDLTCIIDKSQREEAVAQNLDGYKVSVYKINQDIKIDLWANIRVTYNTFMYHGSSGSPVFDGFGRVFGLHSGGFFFGFPKPNESVIEFCYPLLYIFQKIVNDLMGQTEVMRRIQEEAKGNPYLGEILASVVGKSGNKVQTRGGQKEGNEGGSRGDTLETKTSDSDEEMDTS